MTSYRHLPPVQFRSKYIRIMLFNKMLLSNSKTMQKTLINVPELNVFLFLGVPGVRVQYLEISGHSY